MALETLGDWKQGWTILGDIDNHTELAIAFGEDKTIADNMHWDFEPEEDEQFRRVQFGQLLHLFVNNARIIDTDTVSGLVIDVTDEYDWSEEGRARGIYTLKSEDTGEAYSANSDDPEHLLSLMENYVEEAEATG